MLTKFIAPTAGRITFNGRDITAMRPADVARLGLVRSFQISAVFPAPDRARKRAHCAAAQARRFLRLLALEVGARTAQRPRARASRQRRADLLRLFQGGRDLLRPQAGARTRHHPRRRAGDDAARRADGGHGTRGHRPDRRAHPPRVGEPHDPDGRAQSSGRRQPVAPHHGADPRAGAGGGRLSRRCRRTRRSGQAYMGAGHG